MSFYGTPLKHGKGVNKPFRSPFLRNEQNQNQTDGTPTSRRCIPSSKINENLRRKSLGLKAPASSRGFISPLKPLELNSPSKSSETETASGSIGYPSPLKRLRYSPLKPLDRESLSKQKENNMSVKIPGNNSSLKASKNTLPVEFPHINPSEEPTNLTPVPKNDSSLNESALNSIPKFESSSGDSSSKRKNFESELKLPSDNLSRKPEEEKSSHKPVLLKTPPPSPIILGKIKSPEYQPVVTLHRLSPELQNLTNISKKDLAVLIKRISDKQREMVELRAKMSPARKHNIEKIVASIGRWREAFEEALETLRESLAEKNGRPFSTSDVLKLLSIPNSIVHFSEEENDYIYPKL